ncbi:FAD-binding oxidoreductase [Mesorhizobium sp. M0118]|uniref:FAD-binding oxidoreductase n=1 Tax=Mesorhizobium sp. M0118 TaxID=2956884 RepID=UPI003339ABC7
MTRDFGFVIIGGGILGSATAALAAGMGLDPLVVRRPDTVSPNADTLRNQGWLQSGVMYPISHFASEQAYANFAAQTFFAGRELLAMCGLPVPQGRGLLGVSDASRLAELTRKRQLLRLSRHEFAQIETAEAKRIMGKHYEKLSIYFWIPDGPFDEAAVLSHFRAEATRDGAVFIEVDEPVRLERSSNMVTVKFGDGRQITSPTVVVAAGAGSFGLMHQCGVKLVGELQRTPLVVGDAPADMPASIVVDLGRGFSAVRHERGSSTGPAVVMGTRTKSRHDGAPKRVISLAEQEEFSTFVPPGFQASMARGRYTAGYEVMPNRGLGISPYEPWIHPDGSVIFASPGRATVSALAAQRLVAAVLDRRESERHGRTTSIDTSTCNPWDCQISMHYMPYYSYNDAEE